MMKRVFLLLSLITLTCPTGFTAYQEACYYQILSGGEVNCLLCLRSCVLRDGQTSVCRARKKGDSLCW